MATGVSTTLTGDWLLSIGNRNQTFGTGNLGSVYATGGQPVVANQFGLGTIDSLVIDPAGGYSFSYDAANKKILAYYGNGGLVSHTHDILAIGGITATEPLAIQGGDTFGKNAATNRTIAGASSATKGGVVAVSAGSAAAGTEVNASTDLSAITFNFRAIGR